MASPRKLEIPTPQVLGWARGTYGEREPRALFYRLATSLMDRALAGDPEFSQTEALSVLLLTWNARYYVGRGQRFGEADYQALDTLLASFDHEISSFRARSILSYESSDDPTVTGLFEAFTPTVGFTGAAKTLHMCAPTFFPIWDSILAPKAYGIYKRNANNYIRLIQMTKLQVDGAGSQAFVGNPVKEIDEWNYCRYSMGLAPSG